MLVMVLKCNCCLVTQLCRLFMTPWTAACRLICPWDFWGKNNGVGSHSLLQRILHQESSLRLLHCRWILYRWAMGKPMWYFTVNMFSIHAILMEKLGGKVLDLGKFISLFTSYSLTALHHHPLSLLAWKHLLKCFDSSEYSISWQLNYFKLTLQLNFTFSCM